MAVGSKLSTWIRFLKQYLREPTKVMEPEVEKAIADLATLRPPAFEAARAAVSTRKGPFAASTSHVENDCAAPKGLEGPSLIVRAAAAVTAMEEIIAAARQEGLTGKSSTSGSSAPRAAVPSAVSSSSADVTIEISETPDKDKRVEVSTSASAPKGFKRCYNVPVINAHPDFKDKQLTVLEMRLYGIGDCNALTEAPVRLPNSAFAYAKTRGMTLYGMRAVMSSLDVPSPPKEPVIKEEVIEPVTKEEPTGSGAI